MFLVKTIFITLLSAFLTQAFAERLAVVKSDFAVVYSDITLDTPVGKISKNRVIHVSEKAKKNGMLLATVISGKIAYVQIKDLELAPKKTRTLHDNYKAFFKRYKNKSDVDTIVNVDLGLFDPGNAWIDFTNRMSSDGTSASYGTRLAASYEKFKEYLSISVGVQYLRIANTDTEFASLGGVFSVGLDIWKRRNFSLSSPLSLIYSPVTNLVVGDVVSEGSMLGMQLGLKGNIRKIYRTYSLYGLLGYQRQTTKGLDGSYRKPSSTNKKVEIGNVAFNGFFAVLGVSKHF